MKNKFGYTFEQVQNYLDSLPKIMLENEREIIGKHPSAYSFIKIFFKEYNPERATYLVKDKSYYCKHNSRRTIEDIYRLCNRYTNASLEETYEALIKLWKESLSERGFKFTTFICAEIDKRVYSVFNYGEWLGVHDEFGFDAKLTTNYNNIDIYEERLTYVKIT